MNFRWKLLVTMLLAAKNINCSLNWKRLQGFVSGHPERVVLWLADSMAYCVPRPPFLLSFHSALLRVSFSRYSSIQRKKEDGAFFRFSLKKDTTFLEYMTDLPSHISLARSMLVSKPIPIIGSPHQQAHLKPGWCQLPRGTRLMWKWVTQTQLTLVTKKERRAGCWMDSQQDSLQRPFSFEFESSISGNGLYHLCVWKDVSHFNE